ncbi:MAG: ATP-dependent helicase RecG, partial [Gaiellaceae bacterium]|nr:ATP-dependent helicase RecG [Gaiellaceae bacterium]
MVWPQPRGRIRPERLEHTLDTLPGVGPALRSRLAKLGLRTVRDLLEHRPFRYEDPAPQRRIADLFGEEESVIDGEVVSVNERRRGRLKILTAKVSDGSGQISATWFNQPWLAERLQPG